MVIRRITDVILTKKFEDFARGAVITGGKVFFR